MIEYYLKVMGSADREGNGMYENRKYLVVSLGNEPALRFCV